MAKFTRRIYLGLLLVASAAAIFRALKSSLRDRASGRIGSFDGSFKLCEATMQNFSISRKSGRLLGHFLSHGACYIITRVIDVATIGRFVNKPAGRQKTLKRFSRLHKARFGRFLRVPVQTGFIRSAPDLEQRWPNMWSPKGCLRFSIFALKPEISQRASKTARHFTNPRIQIRISSERDKKSKLGDTLFNSWMR